MIKPTIGRVVWYHSSMEQEQPLAALIAFVHSDTSINIGGFHANGRAFNAIDVQLWQGEGERPTGEYCEWMPYQQGQAAKMEAVEKQLATQDPPPPAATIHTAGNPVPVPAPARPVLGNK